jgi:hypothetical protein
MCGLAAGSTKALLQPVQKPVFLSCQQPAADLLLPIRLEIRSQPVLDKGWRPNLRIAKDMTREYKSVFVPIPAKCPCIDAYF